MRGLSALKSGMISQLFRRLPKFGYVGGTCNFEGVSLLQIYGRSAIKRLFLKTQDIVDKLDIFS